MSSVAIKGSSEVILSNHITHRSRSGLVRSISAS